jgi:hypothetical protein
LLRIGPDFRRKQALAIQYDSARPSTFLAMKQEDRLRAQLRAQTAASSKPSLVHRHRPHVGDEGVASLREPEHRFARLRRLQIEHHAALARARV